MSNEQRVKERNKDLSSKFLQIYVSLLLVFPTHLGIRRRVVRFRFNSFVDGAVAGRAAACDETTS